MLIKTLSCFPDKRLPWGWPRSADQPSKNPVVRSKSYNIPLLLTPVAEYDPDASSVGSGGIRRHSACEMISCLEEQGLAYSDLAPGSELSGPSSNRLCVGSQFNGTIDVSTSASILVTMIKSIITQRCFLHRSRSHGLDSVVSLHPSFLRSPPRHRGHNNGDRSQHGGVLHAVQCIIQPRNHNRTSARVCRLRLRRDIH